MSSDQFKYSRYQKIVALDAAAKLLASEGPAPKEKSCQRCEHFGGGNECEKWNAVVPTEHVENGCDQFLSYIPFQ